MVAKLYRVNGESSYVVADDIFIQSGQGDWVASGPLEEEGLIALISGDIDLSDFDLDADGAEGLFDFVEVPREQWADLTLP